MFSPVALLKSLDTRLAAPANAALCVAFSGGLDSTVLLHSLSQIVAERGYKLRAVHIDHGLHADSTTWSEHCVQQARALQIECVCVRVAVNEIPSLGLEAAARDARYAALRRVLQPGEYLLSAHHADDQLETLLLALMRGAGLSGLSAMPALQPFAAGWLGRPLLDYTRAELEAWARAEKLSWLSDPSNDNLSLDRNLLRQRVVPLLRERWPAVAHTATRTSEHLQEAGGLLESLARADAEGAFIGDQLRVAALETLDPARRRNLLRHWIRQRGARAPSTRKLAAIEHDMLAAADDRLPRVDWDEWEMRRHRGLLYCEPCLSELPTAQAVDWLPTQPLRLPAGLGQLRLSPTDSGLSVAKLSADGALRKLSVRFRAGGEVLQPAGDSLHRKLKKLLQASDILPWWRERLPLVYCGDQLIAVGDLWIAAEFAASPGEPALSVVWDERPLLAGLQRRD